MRSQVLHSCSLILVLHVLYSFLPDVSFCHTGTAVVRRQQRLSQWLRVVAMFCVFLPSLSMVLYSCATCSRRAVAKQCFGAAPVVQMLPGLICNQGGARLRRHKLI